MNIIRHFACILMIALLGGCIRVHEYRAHGSLSIPPDLRDIRDIGVRATTTFQLDDPNSYGSSYAPGATGFLVEYFGQSMSSTLDVSNVRGTYSFADGAEGNLQMHDIGRTVPDQYFIIYAVPTGTLAAAAAPQHVQVLKYGQYHLTLHYDMKGMPHTSTGTVVYGHSSHFENFQLGWKD